MKTLEERTALVLGADGGIGTAICHALTGEGARVVAAARNAEHLQRIEREIRGAGGDLTTRVLDITDDDAVAALVQDVATDGLHIAVNNAGTSHRPAPPPELDIEDIDRVLAVTLRGALIAMRAELLHLADGGVVVNVASTAGLDAVPGIAAYSAAKHGVIGLTRTAALDAAERGIRVNAVAPGPIRSGPVMRAPEDVRRNIAERVPLGRMGTPADVAAATTWLCTPQASFITGTVLRIDGGKTA